RVRSCGRDLAGTPHSVAARSVRGASSQIKPGCPAKGQFLSQGVTQPGCHSARVSLSQGVTQPGCHSARVSLSQGVTQPGCQGQFLVAGCSKMPGTRARNCP